MKLSRSSTSTFVMGCIILIAIYFSSCASYKSGTNGKNDFIPEACAGQIFDLTYGQAKIYIQNYKIATSGSNIYADSMIIKGNNIPYCMEFAVKRSRQWSTYNNMGGLQIFYALKDSTDAIATERLAILLPLTKKGDSISLSDARALIGLHIPAGFADPCPPECDYVDPTVNNK